MKPFLPLPVAGAGLCGAAVRCPDSLSSAAEAADVCREPEGLEALRPGGRPTEAEAGLPLQGHARRVLSAEQQAVSAALAPRWRHPGPSGSDSDLGS